MIKDEQQYEMYLIKLSELIDEYPESEEAQRISEMLSEYERVNYSTGGDVSDELLEYLSNKN